MSDKCINTWLGSKYSTILFFLFILTGCTAAIQQMDFGALYGPSNPKQRLLNAEQLEYRQQHDYVSYHKDVKPIIDSRCVACHGCYDAPCQLKLSSFEGLDRGASKEQVYDAKLFKSRDPTRLFIDASTTAEWRNKDFSPVLNERTDSAEAALDNSVLARLLQLKRDNPLAEKGKLTDTFDLSLNREQECPTIDEFLAYQQKHPQWGMPYAMPGLSLKHESTLLKWLKEGAKIDPRPELSEKALSEISKWESFFNGTSLKQQLVSRYIYEHLFIGHIHFQGHPNDEFFQLVRSTTAPSQSITEISTIRPYEDPGPNQFYYRLRPVVSTIVDKTHFVYELSDKKMQRYHELFFQTDYLVKELPTYQTEDASNPFKTFIDIPPSSRYKFLLDDAHYFVSGFIKGPVCRGKIALNVIRDRFWIVFIKPDLEFSEKSTQFLAENSSLLTLPGAAGDNIGLFDWRTYDDFGKQYLNQKEIFINQAILKDRGPDINFIWDGDGVNDNAALTIFRHSDSATVVKGLLGKTPLTGWVVDYPILERIHYLLVAGFNVYGSAGHQLASRKYMDYLRVDGENNFLRFMPKSQRQKLQNSWYKGLETKLIDYTNEPLFSINYETGITYKTINYKKEFYDLIRTKMGKAAGQLNSVNECKGDFCFNDNSSLAHQKIEQQISELSKLKGKQLDLLPEVSFIRVKAKNPKEYSVFSLLLNKSYKNIAFMLAEDYRHESENDTLTVVPGFIGSYPNFFFSVEQDELADFIEDLSHANTDAERELFYSYYGIRRSNPEFWSVYDWFNKQYKKQQGQFAGVFDMNRYQNL